MGFDISKLTDAVNKYLYSISDVSAMARKAAEEAESKASFGKELSLAIKQDISSHLNKDGGLTDAEGELLNFPNIEGQIKSQIDTATSGIRSTFDQIDGGFGVIRTAGSGSAGSTGNAGNAASTGAGNIGNVRNSETNRDAYSATLSLEALQELSKSKYFSTNLLQSDLFSESGNADKSGSGTELLSSLTSGISALTGNSGVSTSTLGNLFDSDVSLSDLNMNSLLASTLTGLGTSGDTGTASAVIKSLESVLSSDAGTTKAASGATGSTTQNATASGSTGASGNLAQGSSSDLAAALLKAYKNSGTASSVTSVFGDFSL